MRQLICASFTNIIQIYCEKKYEYGHGGGGRCYHLVKTHYIPRKSKSTRKQSTLINCFSKNSIGPEILYSSNRKLFYLTVQHYNIPAYPKPIQMLSFSKCEINFFFFYFWMLTVIFNLLPSSTNILLILSVVNVTQCLLALWIRAFVGSAR